MPTKSSLRAVNLYGTGGPLARGVDDAGCQVLYWLTDGTSGVESFQSNFPESKVLSKPGEWPIVDLADEGLDLVFAQPKEDQRAESLRVALLMRPQAFVLETGADLYEDQATRSAWTEMWVGAGYNVTVMLANAATLGLPQLRRRTYFIAAQAFMDFKASGSQLAAATTVREAIGDLAGMRLAADPQTEIVYRSDPQSPFQVLCRKGSKKGVTWHVTSPGAPSIESLIPHIKPGQHVGRIPDEIYAKTYWKERRKSMSRGGKGKPSFFYRRLHWDRPSPSLPGDIRFVHPDDDRFITPREAARLMGIPDDFVFACPTASRANMEAGRGASPYVVRVLLAQLLRFLQTPDGRPHKAEVDLSEFKVASLASAEPKEPKQRKRRMAKV